MLRVLHRALILAGMSFISTTFLALSMSADAFAASVASGVKIQKPRWRDAMRIGGIFGAVETATPLVGWLIGLAASGFIDKIDHWIAFLILGGIGIKMLHEGFENDHTEDASARPAGMKLHRTILIAIGTSIDALAVGVTLAFLHVNIWISAAAIGAATFCMATVGIMTSHHIGLRAGKYAEIAGGVVLIVIGTHILLEHLGYIS